MEIVELQSNQIKRASEVLAASFANYPMFNFYFPNLQRRTRYLPWYFKNILNAAMRFGTVYTTSEITGVLFILPPNHTEISLWEYVQSGFLLTPFILGFRNYKRSMECEAFVGTTQVQLMKNRPHYYLWGLAVDPEHKAQGIGKTLMKPLLAQADTKEIPIYLETHDENNVRYYQKYGFELILTTSIPKYQLPIWCMMREPGSKAYIA
ncbi:MAG: GNAT family N-acetyltransferase [Anaerolineaceae bacterium]|nr:GNAT family N-acetyltransferase [Anaerolineaceae bacterium]